MFNFSHNSAWFDWQLYFYNGILNQLGNAIYSTFSHNSAWLVWDRTHFILWWFRRRRETKCKIHRVSVQSFASLDRLLRWQTLILKLLLILYSSGRKKRGSFLLLKLPLQFWLQRSSHFKVCDLRRRRHNVLQGQEKAGSQVHSRRPVHTFRSHCNDQLSQILGCQNLCCMLRYATRCGPWP